jgi:hypothetical protein
MESSSDIPVPVAMERDQLRLPQKGPGAQPPVLSYKYALKPVQVQKMGREQLEALCLEQAFLLWLIIAIVRNPLAAIASRIIAIDLLVYFVEKTLRGSLTEITERSRVYISGDFGIAKRLGIHPNTVSKSFKNLETHQLIQRSYTYDEEKQREYLDIALTPIHLSQPQRLQDKTLRKMTKAGTKTKQKVPQGNVSIDPSTSTLSCPSCGSEDLVITCRDCGTSGTVGEYEQGPQIDNETLTVESETTTPLNKICVVESINAHQDSTVQDIALVEYDLSEGTQDSVPTEIVQDIVADLLASPDPQPEESPQQAPVIPSDQKISPGKVIAAQLCCRIGHGQIIWATGSRKASDKYRAKPKGYRPNIRAYLMGDPDHIYGSYLLREDGTTYVLAFDFDEKERALHEKHETLLQQLARAGASAVYWPRLDNRGHLEIYFDSPVDPQAAWLWCISVCPDLEGVGEVYPVKTPSCDKWNEPLSWPLYQRRGRIVTPCQPKTIFATNPDQVLMPALKIREIAQLLSQAVTPAALVPPLPESLREKEQPRAIQRTQARPAETATLSDADIAKIVIADFNKSTTWEELADRCGGMTRDGKFRAVWRVEDTASVAVDKDGRCACDHGRTAGFPKKFDKYECWCLIEGGLGYKKTDLARRCKEYREQQGIQIPSLPVQPDQAEQKNAPIPEPQSLQMQALMEISTKKCEDVGRQNEQEGDQGRVMATQSLQDVTGSTEIELPDKNIQMVLFELASRQGRYYPSRRCEKCGCPYFYDLAGYNTCCRCLPPKGVSDQAFDIIRLSCVKPGARF